MKKKDSIGSPTLLGTSAMLSPPTENIQRIFLTSYNLYKTTKSTKNLLSKEQTVIKINKKHVKGGPDIRLEAAVHATTRKTAEKHA